MQGGSRGGYGVHTHPKAGAGSSAVSRPQSVTAVGSAATSSTPKRAPDLAHVFVRASSFRVAGGQSSTLRWLAVSPGDTGRTLRLASTVEGLQVLALLGHPQATQLVSRELRMEEITAGVLASAPSISSNLPAGPVATPVSLPLLAQGQTTLHTHAHVVFQDYSPIFCLDMGPSVMSVDPASGQTLFDRVAASMFVAVLALVDPPDSPDCGAFPSQAPVRANFFVSVLAFGPYPGNEVATLCQHKLVTKDNVLAFISEICHKLVEVEKVNQEIMRTQPSSVCVDHFDVADALQSALWVANTALPSSCPHVTMITDAVSVPFRLSHKIHPLIAEYCGQHLTLSSINVSSEQPESWILGCVPNHHVLQYAVRCCGGTCWNWSDICCEETELSDAMDYLRRCRVASSASLSGVLDIHEKDSDHTQDTVGAEGIEEEEEESRQLADDLDLEEKEFIRNSLEGDSFSYVEHAVVQHRIASLHSKSTCARSAVDRQHSHFSIFSLRDLALRSSVIVRSACLQPSRLPDASILRSLRNALLLWQPSFTDKDSMVSLDPLLDALDSETPFSSSSRSVFNISYIFETSTNLLSGVHLRGEDFPSLSYSLSVVPLEEILFIRSREGFKMVSWKGSDSSSRWESERERGFRTLRMLFAWSNEILLSYTASEVPDPRDGQTIEVSMTVLSVSGSRSALLNLDEVLLSARAITVADRKLEECCSIRHSASGTTQHQASTVDHRHQHGPRGVDNSTRVRSRKVYQPAVWTLPEGPLDESCRQCLKSLTQNSGYKNATVAEALACFRTYHMEIVLLPAEPIAGERRREFSEYLLHPEKSKPELDRYFRGPANTLGLACANWSSMEIGGEMYAKFFFSGPGGSGSTNASEPALRRSSESPLSSQERICEGFCILVMRNVDANLRSLSFNFFALSAERCLTEVDKFAHMLGNLHASHKFQVSQTRILVDMYNSMTRVVGAESSGASGRCGVLMPSQIRKVQWQWKLPCWTMAPRILDTLVTTRLKETFHLCRATKLIFLKQLDLSPFDTRQMDAVSVADKDAANFPPLSTVFPCALAYVISVDIEKEAIVTEFWMQLQSGFLHAPRGGSGSHAEQMNETRFLKDMLERFHTKDQHQLSVLSTFGILLKHQEVDDPASLPEQQPAPANSSASLAIKGKVSRRPAVDLRSMYFSTDLSAVQRQQLAHSRPSHLLAPANISPLLNRAQRRGVQSVATESHRNVFHSPTRTPTEPASEYSSSSSSITASQLLKFQPSESGSRLFFTLGGLLDRGERAILRFPLLEDMESVKHSPSSPSGEKRVADELEVTESTSEGGMEGPSVTSPPPEGYVETIHAANMMLMERMIEALDLSQTFRVALDADTLERVVQDFEPARWLLDHGEGDLLRCFCLCPESKRAENRSVLLIFLCETRNAEFWAKFDMLDLYVCECSEGDLESTFHPQKKETPQFSLHTRPSAQHTPDLGGAVLDQEEAFYSATYSLDFSDASRSLVAFLRDLHSLYFASCVQASLCASVPIQRQDLATSLQACIEYSTEVDLTSFAEVWTQSSNVAMLAKNNAVLEALRVTAMQLEADFLRKLAVYFQPVPGCPEYFFLRPSSALAGTAAMGQEGGISAAVSAPTRERSPRLPFNSSASKNSPHDMVLPLDRSELETQSMLSSEGEASLLYGGDEVGALEYQRDVDRMLNEGPVWHPQASTIVDSTDEWVRETVVSVVDLSGKEPPLVIEDDEEEDGYLSSEIPEDQSEGLSVEEDGLSTFTDSLRLPLLVELDVPLHELVAAKVPVFLRLECVCRHNMGSETEDSQSRTSSFYGFDGPNDQARTFPVSQFPVPPGFVIPSTEMASSSELHTPLALDDKLLSVMSPVGSGIGGQPPGDGNTLDIPSSMMLRLVCITPEADKIALLHSQMDSSKEARENIEILYRRFLSKQTMAARAEFVEFSSRSPSDLRRLMYTRPDISSFLEPMNHARGISIRSLPRSLQNAIIRTRQRIGSLVAHRVLCQLLVTRPLTSTTLDVVNSQMQLLSVSEVVRFSIPCMFVDNKGGYNMLPAMLQKEPKDFTLLKVNELFVAVQPMRGTTGSSNLLLSSSSSSQSLLSQDQRRSSQRLSVAVDGMASSEDLIQRTTSSSSTSASLTLDFDFEIPYWLLLWIQHSSSSIIVNLYVPGDSTLNVETICTSLRSDLEDVLCKINRILLLNNLLDTHSCSPFLLPEPHTSLQNNSTRRSSVGGGVGTPYDDSSDEENSEFANTLAFYERSKAFKAGQFSCDCQHSMVFPLHPRLESGLAIRSLSAFALQHFHVSNRPQVFVCRDNQRGSVYYMTLSSLCDNIGAVGGNTVSADPQLMHVHVQELLILQMFGVDSPSQDLIENLEIRLQSQLDVFTLSLITDDLFRYPQLRIKFSELQFIHMASQHEMIPSSSRYGVPLPAQVENPRIFVSFLQQNLRQFVRPLLVMSPADDQTFALSCHLAHRDCESSPKEVTLSGELSGVHVISHKGFLLIPVQSENGEGTSAPFLVEDPQGAVQMVHSAALVPHPDSPDVESQSISAARVQIKTGKTLKIHLPSFTSRQECRATLSVVTPWGRANFSVHLVSLRRKSIFSAAIKDAEPAVWVPAKIFDWNQSVDTLQQELQILHKHPESFFLYVTVPKAVASNAVQLKSGMGKAFCIIKLGIESLDPQTHPSIPPFTLHVQDEFGSRLQDSVSEWPRPPWNALQDFRLPPHPPGTSIAESLISSQSELLERSPCPLMLTFEMWYRGDVDPSTIMQKICRAANQSLHEYALEEFYLVRKCPFDAPPAVVDSNVGDEQTAGSARDRVESDIPFLGKKGIVMQRSRDGLEKFMAMEQVLSQSRSYGTPTVSQLSYPLMIPSFAMVMLMREIQRLFEEMSIHIPVFPLILSQSSFRLDRVLALTEESLWDNMQELLDADSDGLYLLVAAGSRNIGQVLHPHTGEAGEDDLAEFTTNEDTHEAFLQKFMLHLHHLEPEDTVSAASTPSLQTNGLQVTAQRRKLLAFVSICSHEIVLSTYNWEADSAALLHQRFLTLVQWTKKRVFLLYNILHQKMGLFLHAVNPDILSPERFFLFNTTAGVDANVNLRMVSAKHGAASVENVPSGVRQDKKETMGGSKHGRSPSATSTTTTASSSSAIIVSGAPAALQGLTAASHGASSTGSSEVTTAPPLVRKSSQTSFLDSTGSVTFQSQEEDMQLSLEVLDTLVHHRNPPKPTKSWRPSSVSLKPDIPRAPVPMPSPAAAAAGSAAHAAMRAAKYRGHSSVKLKTPQTVLVPPLPMLSDDSGPKLRHAGSVDSLSSIGSLDLPSENPGGIHMTGGSSSTTGSGSSQHRRRKTGYTHRPFQFQLRYVTPSIHAHRQLQQQRLQQLRAQRTMLLESGVFSEEDGHRERQKALRSLRMVRDVDPIMAHGLEFAETIMWGRHQQDRWVRRSALLAQLVSASSTGAEVILPSGSVSVSGLSNSSSTNSLASTIGSYTQPFDAVSKPSTATTSSSSSNYPLGAGMLSRTPYLQSSPPPGSGSDVSVAPPSRSPSPPPHVDLEQQQLDVQEITRTARLFHFCRVPFILNEVHVPELSPLGKWGQGAQQDASTSTTTSGGGERRHRWQEGGEHGADGAAAMEDTSTDLSVNGAGDERQQLAKQVEEEVLFEREVHLHRLVYEEFLNEYTSRLEALGFLVVSVTRSDEDQPSCLARPMSANHMRGSASLTCHAVPGSSQVLHTNRSVDSIQEGMSRVQPPSALEVQLEELRSRKRSRSSGSGREMKVGDDEDVDGERYRHVGKGGKRGGPPNPWRPGPPQVAGLQSTFLGTRPHSTSVGDIRTYSPDLGAPNCCNSRSAELIVNGRLFQLRPFSAFLYKPFRPFLLVMELGFSGTNVFLNLHILDTHSVAGDSLSVSSDRGSIHGRRFDKPQRRHFLEQVNVLKNKLHLNSFVYDFHVHQFSEIVCGRTELRPSFPIVDVLEAFVEKHSIAPLYARHRVQSHSFLFDSEDIGCEETSSLQAEDFYRYLCQNSDSYRVRTLGGGHPRKGCTVLVTQHRIFFRKNTDVDAFVGSTTPPVSASTSAHASRSGSVTMSSASGGPSSLGGSPQAGVGSHVGAPSIPYVCTCVVSFCKPSAAEYAEAERRQEEAMQAPSTPPLQGGRRKFVPPAPAPKRSGLTMMLPPSLYHEEDDSSTSSVSSSAASSSRVAPAASSFHTASAPAGQQSSRRGLIKVLLHVICVQEDSKMAQQALRVQNSQQLPQVSPSGATGRGLPPTRDFKNSVDDFAQWVSVELEQDVRTSMKAAKTDFVRDSVWDRLLNPDSKLTLSQYQLLEKTTACIHVEEIDPILLAFTDGDHTLPWTQILAHLKSRYGEIARLAQVDEDLHLFISSGSDSDLLMDVSLSSRRPSRSHPPRGRVEGQGGESHVAPITMLPSPKPFDSHSPPPRLAYYPNNERVEVILRRRQVPPSKRPPPNPSPLAPPAAGAPRPLSLTWLASGSPNAPHTAHSLLEQSHRPLPWTHAQDERAMVTELINAITFYIYHLACTTSL